ncbi:MAG: transcription factor IIB (ISS), partial [Trebouxia sp. A1-2]
NCTLCGAVVEGQNLSSEVTFAKGAGGESAAVGQYVTDGSRAGTRLSGGRVYNQVDSHEKSLAKGRDEIQHLVLQLEITPHGDTIEGAHRLYRIALQRNFTRGRRTAQVAGTCLYIFCRQEQKPFMLIDISDVLQINVFVLGGVFLQMCHLLRLEEHPMFSRPIDPSLYIHRFVHKLMVENRDFTRQKQNAVTNTALRLVKSMKRDWMQ